MRWLRLYNEALDDPKVQRLPDALFRTWINLLCLTSQHDHDLGTLPCVDDIAFRLRMSVQDAELSLSELIARGLLDDTAGVLSPHGWRERQPASDDVTARVNLHRERKRQGATLPGKPEPSKPKVTVNVSSNVAPNVLDVDSDKTQTKTQTRPDSPPPATQAPPTASKQPSPAPKPNRSGEVIDAIRAEGFEVETNIRDHAAVKKSSARPADIAAAYCAVLRGDWGDDWLVANLSIAAVVPRINGYLAWRDGVRSRASPPPLDFKQANYQRNQDMLSRIAGGEDP